MKLATLILVMALAPDSLFAQEAGQATILKTEPNRTELNEHLRILQPFVGTWILDGKMVNGDPVWAKNVYTVGIGGNYLIARSYTKDGDGESQVNMTIWHWDREKSKLVSHAFSRLGDHTEEEPTVELIDGKATVTSISAKPGSPVAVRSTVQMIDENSFSLKISTSATKPANILDGVFVRQN